MCNALVRNDPLFEIINTLSFTNMLICGLRLTAYISRPTVYGLRLTAYGLRLTAYGSLLYLTSSELHLMTLMILISYDLGHLCHLCLGLYYCCSPVFLSLLR